MKKRLIVSRWLTVFLFFFSICFTAVSYADQEQDKILEKVTVTNVEVPVRVLQKGKPVTGLTKDDFVLYENKKKVKINGFFIKRKKIKFNAEQTAGVEPVPGAAPRTFVLVFNVTSYNEEFRKAVNHLFDKVLAPTDQLMVFANDVTRKYPDLKDKESIKQQVIGDLKKESRKVKRRLLEYIQRLETYLKVDDFRAKLARRDAEQAQRLIGFLQKYLISWNGYKKQYLTPRVDRFYYFSRFLEKVKTEKWVLNFYQFEFFPRIRLSSNTMNKMRDVAMELSNSNRPADVAQGRKLDTMLNQLNIELNIDQSFPNQEITKLFYKVDATFHSFFIRTNNPSFLQDFEYKTISSDIERVLKGITDVTGGRNISSTNLVDSLQKVSEVEDLYYVLTYVPRNPKKAGKLKIKVKNKKCKVLYDDNFRVDYITDYFKKLESKIQTPDVKVDAFSFRRKMMSFTLKNYLMRKIEKQPKPVGQLKVRIRIIDAKNKPFFDKGRILTAVKKETKISIPFKTIKRGNYNFLIDVIDMFTGKEDNFVENVKVR